MSYRVVHDYYRQELLDFFTPYASPFWAVTFEVEITGFRRFLSEREYPTYLNLCYAVTRAAQGIEDFRYRLEEGELRLYDELHPALTLPADDGLFRFVYYDFDESFEAFNAAVARQADGAPGERSMEEPARKAWLFFSSLPRVPFTGLTHAYRGPDDCEPRVSFGAFREIEGRTYVPVGLQVNHRLIDGRPVGELVERLERELARLGESSGEAG